MEKTISLVKFLSNYYGINCSSLHLLSHEEVGKLCPYLERCSRTFLSKNKELISLGQVILVKDAKNNVVPYYSPYEVTPDFKELNLDMTLLKIEDKTSKSDIIDSFNELSNWELIQLLQKYKGKISFYRVIKREIENRGLEENKTKYKRCKEKRKKVYDD